MAYNFTGQPLGPVWEPNFMEVTHQKDGTTYQVQIYPDYFNEQLKASRKPMHFYYKPQTITIAREPNNDYKFNFIKFEGILTQDDNVAVKEAQAEVAGGVAAFTTTFKIPDEVIENIKNKLKEKCLNDLKYSVLSRWGMRQGMPDPELGVVPIISNLCAVSSLSMTDENSPDAKKADNPWLCKVEGTNFDTTVKDEKGNVIANGSTSPTGENAYTIMLGQYPATILEQAFKGASSPIYVVNKLRHMFYMDDFHAEIHANAKMVFDYFSAQVKVKYFWAEGDFQTSISDLVKRGAIRYSITMNDMLLSEEQKKEYKAQTDKIFEKIQDWLNQTMLSMKPPEEKPAEAANPGGFWGVGASISMKYDHAEEHQSLDFVQDISETYLEYNIISSHLEGLCNVIGKSGNIGKYFMVVRLDESFQKIHIAATCNANWLSDDGKLGDPIHEINLQISYPESDGSLKTRSSGRFMENLGSPRSDKEKDFIWTKANKDNVFIAEFLRLDNKKGIDPNKITVKKTIVYNEDPSVEIAKNTLSVEEVVNDRIVTVSADTIGTLKIAPIKLSSSSLPSKVQVLVTIKRPKKDPVTKLFTSDNAKQEQSYFVYSNQFAPGMEWSYQVQVIVAGEFPDPDLSWTGPEIAKTGSIPLIAEIPPVPDDLKEALKKYLAAK